MRRPARPLALCLAALLLSLSGASAETAEVRRVIDGDTFETRQGHRVRLIGVDAPEYRPWDDIAEPYGREAGSRLRQLIGGKRVRLEKDVSEYDRYGRLLRYVYDEQGVFINETLVREGLAEARAYRPDIARQKRLDRAEREARGGRKGLWSVATSDDAKA
ncbi:MAG: Thermonuclease [Candidatus Omnitrophica bacterium]|nr:Thermonuclease [Candidatus Omnitrophota bacterium]